MMAEDYASTLKKIINFTQTKFLILAKIVGYDISYISKWCNGTKLPATKHIEQINDELARYFAETIQQDNKKKAFCKAFSIPPETDELSFEINQRLCAAYRASLKKNPAGKNKSYHSAIKVITGHHDVSIFIAELLQKELQEINGESDLLIFGEFCALADINFWKYFDSCKTSATRLTIRAGLDKDKLSSQPKYMKHLYRVLNRLLDYDFLFYDCKALEHTNLIILKDRFVLQYAMRADGIIDMCTYISDELLVQDIYNKFLLNFVTQNMLLTPAKSLGMDEIGFRNTFYSANHFFFFLTNGFEFLLPRTAFDNIIKIAGSEAYPQDMSYHVRRLRVTWEELLEKVDIDFMIPTTSIMRYIETGYIYITDIEYRLTPAERKAHITSILETMKKNPLITMGALQTSAETSEYQGANLSFYSNLSSGFFKKNRQYIHNDASSFYVVSDKQLLNIVQDSFKRLKELDVYHRYTVDEITEKYEIYKSLIERTLNLQEDEWDASTTKAIAK